ncbi:uncharacterized protein LOC580152 [Strongylocentrotus purpuratus]|uniref:Integrase catalytic domain-containing protein n=1 Tax=Strongylocentrotus purpuratus TaxID=7668 RepID=A0A7M7SZS3_STRPU|nr:uncharacterized protein LOC580152 [Strongylocentrotus purpuratus]
MSEKVKRRTAKAKLTRKEKAVRLQIDENRPSSEVSDMFVEYQQAYHELIGIHEVYAATIEDDATFEQEEQWMEKCQKDFLMFQMDVKDYVRKESPTPVVEVQDRNNQADPNPLPDDIHTSSEVNQASPPTSHVRQVSSFQLERPKLPKFNGDVREYGIFKSDFKHLVESRYGNRDAISILRTCLQGRPLDLIRGIGADYEAAWEHLDCIYGDPRFVADAIMNDLHKFKPLKENEDGRFCDLVHMVRRSYNTLKEIGRENDMNNSNMLAMIERKMNPDDRRVWFRYQEIDKDEQQSAVSLEMLLKWMSGEMKARMRANAPLRSDSRHAVGHMSQTPQRQQSEETLQHRCWICKTGDHWVDQCKKFTSKTARERLQFVKDQHACFSCLKKAGRNHSMATCRRRQQCPEMRDGKRCNYFHHPLLHFDSEGATGRSTVGVAAVDSGEAMLPLVTADVGHRRNILRGNVLLDSGAQISLIRDEFAAELGLEGISATITVTKIGRDEETLTTKKYKVPIREVNKSKTIMVTALGIDCISDDVAAVNLPELAQKFQLREEDLQRGSGPVDLLVGIDHARLHAGEVRVVGGCAARKSAVGWVVFGTTQREAENRTRVLHVKLASPVDLTDFWKIESGGVNPTSCQCTQSGLTKQEAEEERIIRASSRKVGRQWEISYPWDKDPDLLPNNKFLAEKMLFAAERKLRKNPEHTEAYKSKIQEMTEMGFAKKLEKDEMTTYKGPVHYISHHAVIRPDNKSTPLRIVFNSSAIYKGHCLNEYWKKGPDLLNNLFGVLLRFREHPVAICADISKMYHRILIPERDQHVHRFLWRDMNQEKESDVYMMKVVTFGDKPAAAMAQIGVRLTAEEGEAKYPEAAAILKRNIYMDDICDSVETEDTAKKRIAEVDELLETGGFKVKGWQSNKPLDGGNKQENMKLLEEIAEEKVLGVVWERHNDTFSYKVKLQETDKETEKLTKRKILGKVARIYDPIGFAAPIIIKAKTGLQKLWQSGYDWDEELPDGDEWRGLFREMSKLNDISLERCLKPQNAQGRPVLCIFCDASEIAYGACAYLRWKTDDDKYEVRFVSAKSKVAPLKALTIPRLELLAGVLAARMHEAISNEMRLQVEKAKIQKGPKPDDKVTLSPTELDSAEKYWVKRAQISLLPRLEKGEFKVLTPFVDDDGVIRVGGRVENLVTSYESKHPALLPASHHISLMIIRSAHELGHHGVAVTTAKTRRKYWILQGYRLAKTVKHRCVTCRAAECRRETQIMANLPSCRLAPFTPPFHYTSCDYFGPYLVKVGRNKKAKHYGIIFTCLNTRAVHLEMATDCSTMEFLQALRRFIAVRGQPAQFLSDNGTQFVGAERELREMVRGWSERELKDFCAEKRVVWKFVTPGAPHQNGCAEAMVKSCKFALKRAIGEQVLTPLELYTCFLEVANLVNERPIGRVGNDPDDGGYLCPNDLLLGRSSSKVPHGPFRETRNPRHRVEFVQQIVNSFWKSWNRDVFPLLVPRRKWNTERRNVRVGDIAMLADANAVRGKWTIARVVQVYPGVDGTVRNVKVKTVSGEYRSSRTSIVKSIATNTSITTSTRTANATKTKHHHNLCTTTITTTRGNHRYSNTTAITTITTTPATSTAISPPPP